MTDSLVCHLCGDP